VVATGRRRRLLAAGDRDEAGEQNRGEKREEKNRGSGMGLEVGRSPAEVVRRNTEVVGGRGR